MSVHVATVNLTGAAVGTKGTVPIGQALPPPTIDQQMRPLQQDSGATLVVKNESGCVLLCTWPVSGESLTITAGQWPQLRVPPDEPELDFIVIGVIPNAPISFLLADLYFPGETVDGIGSLGNSPIGLSGGGVPLSVTTVQNDGNASPTTFIEGTETGNASGSNVVINNDGSMFLAELVLGPTYQKIFQSIVGAAVGADAIVLGANKANFTHIQNELKVDRASSLDAGDITTSGTGNITLDNGTSGTPVYRVNDAVNNTHGYMDMFAEQLRLVMAYRGAPEVVHLKVDAQTGAIIVPGTLQVVGGVTVVGNATSAGAYGVPVQVSVVKDFNITNTTLTAIASFTTPNDGVNHDLLVLGQLYVGSGNTNNGVVTLEVAYTDPHQGGLTLFFNVYGQANLINGIAQAKGVGIQTDPRHIRCSPNTAAIVRYQNSAAGAISDFASAVITLMS